MTVSNISYKDNCYLLPVDYDTRDKNLAHRLIKEVTQKTAKELAVALLFAGTCCLFFYGGPAVLLTWVVVPPILIDAVTMVTVNAALRIASAVNTYVSQTKPFFTEKTHDSIDKALSWTRAYNFGSFDSDTRSTLTHEFGHALAMKTMLNGSVTIQISPFGGSGATKFNGGTISRIGALFSEKLMVGIIVAAGPAFELAHALYFTYKAHKLDTKDPESSRYLTMMAVHSVAMHALYAISAFFEPGPGHDFNMLWMMGINPIVSVVTIVALPIILKSALIFNDRRNNVG